MQRVKKRTGHISVSAKCFSVILALMIFALPCHAMTVSGVPEWLEGAVVRSLNAVWQEIPDSPEIDREGTLAIVASRLFAGYDVKVSTGRDEPAITFSRHENETVSLDVKINIPELRGIALEWFSNDIAGLDYEISKLIDDVPQSALTWADEALRERIRDILKAIVPGWDFSQQIYISPASTSITIAFRPSSPMVLAIQPALYSRTIPAVFRTDLEARLIPELSPLIGVPVKWAELHRPEIEKFARDYLTERHAIENLRAEMNIRFSAGAISKLEARVDSQDFLFEMWVAAYAGVEGRYPELGAFFAYGPPFIRFDPEIYAELIFSLDNFSEVHRIGARLELFSNFWAGAENQWPDNEYFIRIQYNPVRSRLPYVWWRWSPQLEVHEGALGYRIDEHISIELYYYRTDDDKVGFRGMWHL